MSTPSFALALGIVVGLVGFASAEPASVKKVASVEGITEYRLPNGLRILSFPEATRPEVTVNLTVFAGSRHEGYGETGMAHLIEHLLCKGTPSRPDLPRLLKERGGQWNASTWLDCTNYYETLPSSQENVAFAVQLEADRLVNAFMRNQDLATEMPVVRNEFESGEDIPDYILEQRMRAVAYAWHNYGKPEIGNRSDIERVPIDRLRGFYRKHYRPDNAMLIIAGRFDEAKALDEIAKAFGGLARPEEPLDQTYTEEPPQDGERSVTLRRVGDLGAVGVLYHIPAAAHPDLAALQVLSKILTTAPSGRLYKALVASGKASSIRSRAAAQHDPSELLIMARVARGKSRDEVRETLLNVVEQIGDIPIRPEEVERARQELLSERDLLVNEPNPMLLVIHLSNWSAKGDWRLFFLHRDRIEKVTPEQVQAVAQRYLQPSNRTVGLFVPTEKPERTPVPATPNIAALVDAYKRQGPGALGEPFDTAPAQIEARVLRPQPIGHVKVALLPKKTRNETVHLLLNLRYGNAENLKGLVEASAFLPELMTRGTQRNSRSEIREKLDRNRTRLTASGSLGLVSLSLDTRRSSLAETLDLLCQMLREPTLTADEFENLKAEKLAELDEWRTNPTRLASNHLNRLLSSYPTDDVRHVPSIDEHIKRVKALRVEQVKSLHAHYLSSSQGELVIIGDFEPSQVLPPITKALDGWHADQPYAAIERPYQSHLKPEHPTILTADKANAVYFSGLTLPMRDDAPDYAALVLANFILGGAEYDNRGFQDENTDMFASQAFSADGNVSSRLVDRLRHQGGLSYGVASFFTASNLDNSARLTIYANTSPGKISKVEAAVAEELKRWVEAGVTPVELNRAKSGYLLQQEIDRASDPKLALLLARQLRVSRTLQYVGDLETKIRRLNVEDISRALHQHINLKRLSTVTAGDLSPATLPSPN